MLFRSGDVEDVDKGRWLGGGSGVKVQTDGNANTAAAKRERGEGGERRGEECEALTTEGRVGQTETCSGGGEGGSLESRRHPDMALTLTLKTWCTSA